MYVAPQCNRHIDENNNDDDNRDMQSDQTYGLRITRAHIYTYTGTLHSLDGVCMHLRCICICVCLCHSLLTSFAAHTHIHCRSKAKCMRWLNVWAIYGMILLSILYLYIGICRSAIILLNLFELDQSKIRKWTRCIM